jgi:rRNA maturation protein Nop10
MKDACPKCDSPAFSTAPAKYSPEDRMGMYRRIAKKEIKDNS